MSNEPLTTLSAPQPSTSEPSTDAPPTDRAADVAMMLAAVERMETVMRGERAAFERLRADLGDMASTVALAKAALASFAIKPDDAGDGKAAGKSSDVTALLQAIENRIGAMAQVIDGANVSEANDGAVTPPPVAEAEAPSASHPQAVNATDSATEAAPGPAPDVAPSVAMLDSMAGTLAIAMPEFVPPQPHSRAAEPEPLEQPMPPAEDATPVEAAAPPTIDPVMPNIDLMTSFAQVVTMPILPAEIGTAVIFAPKEPAPEAEPQIEVAAEAPASSEAAIPLEVEAAPEPRSVAVQLFEAAPEPQPEIAIEPAREVAPAIVAVTPIETPTETAAEFPLASSDDEDPAEFLYEPDPDPAADLLEPIDFAPPPKPTQPASAAILPSLAPTFSSPAASTFVPWPASIAPSQPKPVLSPEQQPARRPSPPPPAVPHDPLAPLKTMSDEEKIALFS